jgi:hypothetical protein
MVRILDDVAREIMAAECRALRRFWDDCVRVKRKIFKYTSLR